MSPRSTVASTWLRRVPVVAAGEWSYGGIVVVVVVVSWGHGLVGRGVDLLTHSIASDGTQMPVFCGVVMRNRRYRT